MNKPFAISLSILLTFFMLHKSIAQPITFNNTYGQMPYNYGIKIIQAADQGYFILANISANAGNSNIQIIRTDSLGVIVFEKTIGDASIFSANDFIRTSDKGLLITGITNLHPNNGYDVLLIKTDSLAQVEWTRTYGGTGWDMGNAVIATPDNAYLIAGQTFGNTAGQENIFLVKTNLDGDTIWTRVYGGDSTDYATSADVMYDGTYLIGATTKSFGHGNFDGYVLNLDPNGDTIWTQTYGEDKEDIIYSIKQTPDSGFVFVGSTMSYNAIEHEYWLMRFDKNNHLLWKMPEYWQITPGDDIFTNVCITDSAQYAISGYTSSFGAGGFDAAFYLMGEFPVYKCSHTDGSLGNEYAYQAIQTFDKAYAIIGNTDGIGNAISKIYFIKMGENCSYSNVTDNITDVSEFTNSKITRLFSVTPTISTGIYTLNFTEPITNDYKVIIYDVQGRIIPIDDLYKLTDSTFSITISNASDGLYFITLIGTEASQVFKVIKSSK